MTKDEISKKNYYRVCYIKDKVVWVSKIDRKLEDKRYSGTKKCIVTESLTFDNYKTCLF